MSKRGAIYSILIFTMLAVLALCLLKITNNNCIINGVLDMSGWDKKDVISLSGEADFYWEKLLTEQNFVEEPKPDIIAVIPSVWNNYKINGSSLPGKGFGTYRIHVVGAEPGQALAMRVNPFSSDYELYIDDQLVASCGKVGTTESDSLPQYAIRNFEFSPESESFDIIIHVSNYVYARGGAWYAAFLGTPEQINTIDKNVLLHDAFIVSFLVIIILYIIYYCILRKDKSFIPIEIVCFLVICRTLIYGNYLIFDMFPEINFKVLILIGYLTSYFMPSLWLAFIYLAFDVGIPRFVVGLSLGYSLAATLLSLAVSTYTMTHFIFAAEIIIVVICVYLISKLLEAIFINIKEKPVDLYFVLAGIIIWSFCGIRDILFQSFYYGAGVTEYSPIGFVILILLWDFAYAYRYEMLTRDRVRVLEELNAAREREMALELKYLKAQIRPHFIHNALNTIVSISRVDIERARYLLSEFSDYLRSCYDIGRLENSVPIENELSLVRAYVALEQARFGDNLQIEYKTEKVSAEIPPLILEPLVENAITHNKISKTKPLHLTIYVYQNADSVKIGVKDDGEGFRPEAIPLLLGSDQTSRSVGIYNINQRLLKIFGTGLQIKNIESGGADVYMLIPNKGGCVLYESGNY